MATTAVVGNLHRREVEENLTRESKLVWDQNETRTKFRDLVIVL
jgi:hypothetical protein